ncbi:hypothetical protein KR018_004650 [Drosophila ironensis]|nr:hypothetical protein KR018_004650 [Drosophila ironensis]
MHSKLCIVLFAIGLSQVFAVPAPSVTQPDERLMQILMQSRELGNDASHSLDCVNYYSPLLSGAITKYDTDFKQCLADAAQRVEGINDETSENRTQIDSSANNACDALKVCSEIESADDYFSCYSEAGGENAKTMFTISSDASVLLAQVLEEVRLIQVDQYACTNKTQRTYAEDTAVIYEDLNKCVAGAAIPSETTAVPAETTAAPAETTAAPAETTAAPAETTAAPAETTAAPAETTAAPAETTAAPAETTAAPAETTAAPAETTAAPAETTAAPAETTAAPAETTAAPAETTAAPAESTSLSTETPGDRAPEEDLSLYSSVENQKIKDVLRNLQAWFKNQ